MSAPSDQPKPYHHGDLRLVLLRVIKELIAERGIEGLTLRECARRAGVSWSAPHHHFRDKTGMLTAFAVQGFFGLREYMERKLASESDPGLRAAAVGQAYLEFALGNPEHFRVMFRTELLNASDPALEAANHGPFAILVQALRDCDASVGVNDEGGLPHRCLLAWSAVHGYATLCLEGAIQQGYGVSKDAALVVGRDLVLRLVPSLLPGRALTSGKEAPLNTGFQPNE